MARNRDAYDAEQEEYNKRNVFVPIDTFINKGMGQDYDPFDEYEEEEMVVPIEV